MLLLLVLTGGFSNYSSKHPLKGLARVYPNLLSELQQNTSGHSEPWGYGKTSKEALGPADWYEAYPHCGGKAQSPIDIDTYEVEELHSGYLKFTFTKVTKPPTRVVGKLANNGHAPTLTINRSKGTARISGGPLGHGKTYELLQFHFHFGCEDDEGSEHTVNTHSHSGELHLVFYNTKYKPGEASSKHDGLAVIGVFLQSGQRTTRKSLKKLIRTKITKIAKEDRTSRD